MELKNNGKDQLKRKLNFLKIIQTSLLKDDEIEKAQIKLSGIKMKT